MLTPAHFRARLFTRLMTIAGSAGAVASIAGCGGNTTGDTEQTGPGGPYYGTETVCFLWPMDTVGAGGTAGTGGAIGTGGTGGMAGAGGAGTGSAGGMEPVECPSREDAMMYAGDYGCGTQSIDSDGTHANGQCCYTATVQYCAGRPFSTEHGTYTAALHEGSSAWTADGAPDLDGLALPAREALAEAWARDALLEHASVASFARFSLELLAVGAPPELVEAAHRAAIDEVRHARACFALAGAYRGRPVGPSSFPFEGRVDVSADLAHVAARTVEEGCVGETVAAVLAAEQLAGAADPAVRAALEVIAADEARHAALAWRVVAWAVEAGGERVRAAAASAFEAAMDGACEVAPACDPGSGDVLAAHGRLTAAASRAVRVRTIAEIVRPCAAALLAGARPRAEARSAGRASV